MKKNLLLFTLAMLGFATLSAQDAKSILDKLASKNKSYKTLQGIFEYKLENKEANIYENSKGTFFIKGDKYFVEILGTQTFFDGKNAYSYLKEVDELTIQKPEKDDDNFLKPSNLFTIYQKGFKTVYVGKVLEGKIQLHLIDLLPIKEKENYKKLTLKIKAKTNELYSIQSVGKYGDNVTIKMTEIKANKPVANSKFTFNKTKHPDTEIIDMR